MQRHEKRTRITEHTPNIQTPIQVFIVGPERNWIISSSLAGLLVADYSVQSRRRCCGIVQSTAMPCVLVVQVTTMFRKELQSRSSNP
jgi:hypothetical protein